MYFKINTCVSSILNGQAVENKKQTKTKGAKRKNKDQSETDEYSGETQQGQMLGL